MVRGLELGTMLRGWDRHRGITRGIDMRSFLGGGISLLFAAALLVQAVAQERPGRSRNQSLEEQLKPYDVLTTQSSTPSVLEAPARSENNGASDRKKDHRPTIIQGPGYNKGISSPSR